MHRVIIASIAVLGLVSLPACFSDDGGPGGSGGEDSSDGTDGTTGDEGTGTGSGSGTGTDTGTTDATDTDPTTDTTDATDTDPTTDTTTDTTGDDPCDGGNVCVPDPDGWEGPIAIADAGDGCGATYPDQDAALYGGFAVDASSCKCTCGSPNVVCSKVMKAVGYSKINCVDAQGNHDLSENQCYNTFGGSHAVTLAKASSSCAAGGVTPTLPDPSWSSSVVACDGFTPGDGACAGGETCVPAPGDGFDGGVCYYKDGDNACPDGFPEKTVYYTGIDDTRMCPNSCSCSASTPSCKVSVTGYANTNCSSAQGAKTAYSGSDVCAVSNSSIVKSMRPGNVTVSNAGSCSAGAANLSGDVKPAGATTVCCTG